MVRARRPGHGGEWRVRWWDCECIYAPVCLKVLEVVVLALDTLDSRFPFPAARFAMSRSSLSLDVHSLTSTCSSRSSTHYSSTSSRRRRRRLVYRHPYTAHAAGPSAALRGLYARPGTPTPPPIHRLRTSLANTLARREDALDPVRRGQADGEAHRAQAEQQDPRRRRRQAVRRLSEQAHMDLHGPAGRCRAGQRPGRQHLLDQARRHLAHWPRRPMGPRDLRHLCL